MSNSRRALPQAGSAGPEPSERPRPQRRDRRDYGSEHAQHLLSQYLMYVEMADRVSARRALTNSFFVTLHSALVSVVVALSQTAQDWPAVLSLHGAALLLCCLWWRTVRLYRQLNSAKYRVVLALEQRLPAAPFDEEWRLLGHGLDASRYQPLTRLEQWIPVLFGLVYLLTGLLGAPGLRSQAA